MPPVNPTRAGILIFTATALAGPLYTIEGYSPVRNLISQLGAQNTQNSIVMIVGFLALGVGIVADGIRHFCKTMVPFIAFGMSMALAGLLAHKPILPAASYSESAHLVHSALATLAGISITVGLLWQSVLTATLPSRLMIISLATLCVALPLCMLAMQEIQGLIQRMMYLALFVWLWIYYPGKIKASHAPQRVSTSNAAEL